MSNVKAFYLKGLSNEDKNKHKKYIINRRKSARKGKYLTKLYAKTALQKININNSIDGLTPLIPNEI